MPENTLDLSLVLACYNEEAVIRDSVKQIVEVLTNTRFSFEIIFVDDCSTDRTRDMIDKIIAQSPGVIMSRIFHTRNTGRGGAVSDGFRIARGDVVGYIDIDLEVHARYIPSCMMAIRNGADIALAKRVYTLSWRSLDRYFLSHGYNWLRRNLLHVDLDSESGFKFFRRDKLGPLLAETADQGWFWDTEVLVHALRKGHRIVQVPCLFLRRFDKKSSVRPIKDSLVYLRKLWAFRKALYL